MLLKQLVALQIMTNVLALAARHVQGQSQIQSACDSGYSHGSAKAVL